MDERLALKEKLRHLSDRIAETKKRLPAHSVKPPIMMELLALEDEYAALLEKLNADSPVTTASPRCPEPKGP